MRLLPVEDRNAQRNFEKILQTLIDTGGYRIGARWGKATVTFTASATSAQKTIPHGLTRTPVAIFTTGARPANTRLTLQESAAADDTNVYVTGYTAGTGAVTLSQDFYWLAIG